MITLDDVNVSGKVVFVRPDLNCPYDAKTKQIQDSPRMKSAAITIRELADKGAKVIVMAHQGRKGDEDFTDLSQHALLLEQHVKKQVTFVPDVCGEKAKNAIRSTKPGEITLLDNVRNLDDETKFKKINECANATLVKELGPLCDYFVLDGFSVAHRVQASVVGFFSKPVIAGREMQHELEALSKVADPARPLVFVMGGAKPEDSVGIMEEFLRGGKMDVCLTCGVLGTVMIKAKTGKNLGAATEKFLTEKKAAEFLPKAKELLSKYKDKIVVPSDVAYLENGLRKECGIDSLPCAGQIMDIGAKTAQDYSSRLLSAGTIVINGPAGVYEDKNFEQGTKAILDAIQRSNTFSLAGGGHTISAIDKFVRDKKKIGHISLAGKALIAYLSGEELVGVKMINEAKM